MEWHRFEAALKFLALRFPESEKKAAFFHSIRVAVLLWELWYEEELQIAWLFHDSLEDTDISEIEIEKLFGTKVKTIVKANTKNIDLEKSARGRDIIQRCIDTWEDAIIVKICDIYDNFRYYIKIQNISEIERCKLLISYITENKYPIPLKLLCFVQEIQKEQN